MAFQLQSNTKLVVTLPELFNSLSKSWQSALKDEEQKINAIENHLTSVSYIPEFAQIFAALSVEPELIKVVLLGQDPYPNPEHAMGLSFSVPQGVTPLPASLKNIFKELKEDLGVENTSGDLSSWRDQGVLLLNRVLTTSPRESLSHGNVGWEIVTEKIVSIAAEVDPIAILWGNKAQEVAGYFSQDKTITSAHPSPLSSYRGFLGSKPFSKVNEILITEGKVPINWQTH